MSMTIEIPGAFDSYFSGSSVGQGVPEQYDGGTPAAFELAESYQTAEPIKRGRGYSLRLIVETREALVILWGYADACYDANEFGDRDHAEMRAALAVKSRVEALIGTEGLR